MMTGFEETAEEATGSDGLGPWLVTLTDFQADAFSKTARAFEDEGVKTGLVVMPTGCGKTIFFMTAARWVIEDVGGRVLVIAHTGELVSQAQDKASLVGLTAATERAGEHARPDFTAGRGAASLWGDSPLDPQLVVGTVQTLQGKRLKAWPPGHFDLVVIDEGHHAEAETYRRVVAHLRPKWVLGVTATADRGDGKPICGQNQVFEKLIYEYFMHDAVRNGHLKRPVSKVLDTTVDLKKLRVKGAKDLNAEDIEEALLPHVSEIVNELRGKLDGHRAVIFTPMVASADAVASALCGVGVSAVSISGQEDADRRAEIFSEFRNGRYQHIVNAMLLTEGWDEPFIDSAVILRATKSRALYVQMAGRALRKYPGKPNGYIWGLNWETHGHDLVRPVEIFDSPTLRIDPEILDGAQALLDSGAEADLASALKRSQAERRERRRIALTVKAERAKATEHTFDPLLAGPVRAGESGPSTFRYEPPATERQVERVVKMGIDRATASRWSKKQAGGFIGAEIERSKAGFATFKQRQYLRKMGHPSPNSLTFEAASAAIDGLQAKRA